MITESHDSVLSEMLEDPEFELAYVRAEVFQHLANEIYRLRKSQSLSQAALADKSHTHQSRISKLESADLDPRISTVISVAEALGARVEINLVRRESFAEVASSRAVYPEGAVRVFTHASRAASHGGTAVTTESAVSVMISVPVGSRSSD